ncbi:MAG: hypothetical protein PWQ60_787 [Thermoanaerobacteraceae bacterium]|nr:hypothetical protein [Thermoanaerobacteraceae bacterium]
MPILKPFFWGLGAAVLAYMVTPRVKKVARPLLVKGVSGAIGLAEKGKETVEEFRDRRREKARETALGTDSSYDNALEQMRQERNHALNEIKELKNVISQLQNEINEIKQKNEE